MIRLLEYYENEGIYVALCHSTLSEDLVSLEARRIVESMGHRGVHPNDSELLTGSSTRAFVIFDDRGNRLQEINPGHVPLPDSPLADVRSTTSRELHGKQFFLTGVRRVEIGGRPGWIGLAISGQGLRPFIPALYQEVYDHALLPLIPLSMLLLFFNVAVVRRMLKPLERAVTELDALDPGDHNTDPDCGDTQLGCERRHKTAAGHDSGCVTDA